MRRDAGAHFLPCREPAMRLSALLPAFVLATVAGTLPQPAQGQAVPTPASHFGYEMGAEGELANWHELLAYYEAVAQASPRVTLDTLGTSTLGEPFVKLIITSPENHGRLDRYREIQHLLADP
ncbi:MAG: hypothetical protein EA350_02255, partial [Gemmatimonadales bacterium]